MIQAMYTIVANIIDGGFVNRMSVDAIVAYGSYLPVTWACHSIYSIGKYAYSTMMKEAKTCLYTGTITSFILSGIGFLTYIYIPLMFGLSEEQRYMMSQLLFFYFIFMSIRVLGDFMYLKLMYEMKNKNVFIGDVLFWVINIQLDFIVFIKGMPVWYLAITTGIGYIIDDIYKYLERYAEKVVQLQ